VLEPAILIALLGGLHTPDSSATGFPYARVTRKVPFFFLGCLLEKLQNHRFPDEIWYCNSC
jgi:hypothetical protein